MKLVLGYLVCYRRMDSRPADQLLQSLRLWEDKRSILFVNNGFYPMCCRAFWLTMSPYEALLMQKDYSTVIILVVMKKKLLNILPDLFASLLIILWIYTGLNKLLDYSTFKFQLGRSPFIQPISGFVAITIPITELLIAGILIFPKTRMVGFFASLFLMVMFSAYVYAMLHYSYFLPCNCGGVLASLTWENHLIFNIIYSIIAAMGIITLYRLVKNKEKEKVDM